MESNLVKSIKNKISATPNHYPFIAKDWEISKVKQRDLGVAMFTKHGIKSNLVTPFHRPISKIFNLDKLKYNEER